MAWASVSSATQLTTITTEQIFDVKPQLAPRESCHVYVTVNFGGTTDDAIINVYASVDGTTYADVPFMSLVLDKDTDPNSIEFTISGVYQFQVGVTRTGTTDTHTDADMDTRLDGVSI